MKQAVTFSIGSIISSQVSGHGWNLCSNSYKLNMLIGVYLKAQDKH